VAVRELKALHAAIKNDPSITSASAKGDLSEFVAEVFSNRNLQEQLRNKKWRLSDAWKGFKSIIMRMLGVKDPETMLGAALQSVDALMIPSSERMGGKETSRSRRLSAKDIAALYTGSNSMKQFAEQFGTTHIKQADRSPEDAERIGRDYLDDMYANPEDYVAPAEESKLDYSAIMSDGKPFDIQNPVHFVEADAITFANLKAQNDVNLRAKEAYSITRQRKKDLEALVKNLGDFGGYTYVEQALVAKAASKFAVLSDKNGRLKLAAIEPNNRHNIAVVSAEDAGKVIEELRAGKPLKQAFLDGMQVKADENALANQNKNGWQKFEQPDKPETEPTRVTARPIQQPFANAGRAPVARPVARPVPGPGQVLPSLKPVKNPLDEAAEKLAAGAAGTPWCTAGVGTARTQIKNGDFYIYYDKGTPQVAVRMDGTDKIGEIRGNSPQQALTQTQADIATTFIKDKNFKSGDKYLAEVDKKRALLALAKNKETIPFDSLMRFDKNVFTDKGEVKGSSLNRLFRFDLLDGYGVGRPEMPNLVQTFFADRLLQSAKKAYENGYWIFSNFNSTDVEDRNAVDKNVSVEFAKEKYTLPVSQIKALKELNLSVYANQKKPLLSMPALEQITKLYVFNTPAEGFSLPAIKNIKKLDVFRTNAVLNLSKNATIEELIPAQPNLTATINGVKSVKILRLRADYDSKSVFTSLSMPDLEYAQVDSGNDVILKEMEKQVVQTLEVRANANNFSFADFYNDTKTVDTDASLAMLNSITDVIEKHTTKEQASEIFSNLDLDPFTNPEIVIDNLVDVVQSATNNKQETFDIVSKIFKDLDPSIQNGKEKTSLSAPKLKGETPPIDEVQEAPEAPRYARAQAAGFEDVLETADQLIAKPATIRQRAEANLGLGFRTQVLDRLAPLEKVANEMLDPLRGMQMMYYLRMADQKMSFVQQAAGRGVPQIMEYTRKDGQKERLIESVDGPSLANVVDTLKGAPGMNAEAANKLFTLYLAAKRGDRVGYDKLNFGVPEDQIRANVAKIEANKEVRAVFEKAREQYNAYNRDLMRFMAQTGALTPEEAQRLAKTDDYIPYYREENGNAMLVIGGEGTFKVGSLAEQPQLRQLLGGNQKIMDFLTSSVENTSMLVDMGLRNIATKNAMFELEGLGLAQFLGGAPSGPDIVSFKDKGVDKYVRVNTDAAGIPATLLVKGMEGIPVNNSAIVKAMGSMSTLLRRSITINPLYSARQVFRDSVAAPLLSGANFSPVFGALRQIGESATREKLESRGIIGGQIFTGTNEDLSRILGELQTGKMGMSQFIARAEAISMEADALTRRAQYDSYIKQGLSEMEATMMSLESMNFNRKGVSPSVRLASTLIPFFNAQLQSLDVLYRAFTGKMPMNEKLDIQGKLLRRGALLAGTAVAYALLMGDDETYKNATPDEKYGNFFIPIPGMKESLRVPVPFEVGYIFKSLPEAIVNIMRSEEGGEEALKAFKNIAIQTIPGGSSALMPAAAKPLLENLTGYSFFTGRQLETKAEQMEKAEFRFRDNTSEMAKQIGSMTGTSPIKVDNLIRGYTGSMGVALAQAFNFAMPTAGTPEQATKRLSDMPVVGPLFQPQDAGGIVGAVYDRMTEINEVKRTYDKLIKDGRRAEAQAFMQENAESYAKSGVTGNVQAQMSKITQAVNAIKASSMTPDEKRERLTALQDLRIRLATSVRGVL
jgi:hypothetical protein